MDPSRSSRVPQFSANPAGLGADGYPLFSANAIAGSAALLLRWTAPAAVTATALVDWGMFVAPGGPVPPGLSGLGIGYRLYAKVVAGFAGTAPAGPYFGETLDVGIFAAQPDGARAPDGGAAGQDDVLLATATQPLAGMLILDPAGACVLNLTFPLALTAAGQRFLWIPQPFYGLGFLSLTNTAQALVCDGGCGYPGTAQVDPCVAIINFNRALS